MTTLELIKLLEYSDPTGDREIEITALRSSILNTNDKGKPLFDLDMSRLVISSKEQGKLSLFIEMRPFSDPGSKMLIDGLLKK